jgi:hypothetical protein
MGGTVIIYILLGQASNFPILAIQFLLYNIIWVSSLPRLFLCCLERQIYPVNGKIGNGESGEKLKALADEARQVDKV